jgi:molybdopterin synthase catalytic subunit
MVSDSKAGAISTFMGVTRDNFHGKKVVKLEYEAYEPMAVKELTKICDTAREKFDVFHIALYHRVGIICLPFSCFCILLLI